ncbi:hypothetical protein [Pedobacter nutrimenti]|uniref:hypothetical protein n=1 Tax=Pedobacter nutrimenti TaxID=1241337 RepID=UPI0029314CAA|nr:hypothetical protein [Pedobacter nutrimenti]
MKLKSFTVSIALWTMILGSCKKQDIRLTPLASIQIINAVVGGSELQFGTNKATIPNNAYAAYGVLTGSQVLKLSSTVTPDLVYYNQTKNFVNGEVYSLFLTGTPTSVETVFFKEGNIPFHTNNVFGARVINLVKDGVPISVNLQGRANGSFIDNLGYKAISAFKDVSSTASEGDKVLEFRNATTGDLITSFTVPSWNIPRFRNITLVFAGTAGAEIIFRATNY